MAAWLAVMLACPLSGRAETVAYAVDVPRFTLVSNSETEPSRWYASFEDFQPLLPRFDTALGLLGFAAARVTVNLESLSLGYENTRTDLPAFILSGNPPGVRNAQIVGAVRIQLPQDTGFGNRATCANNFGICSSVASVGSVTVSHNHDGTLDYAGASGVTYTANSSAQLQSSHVWSAASSAPADQAALARMQGAGTFGLGYQVNLMAETSGWTGNQSGKDYRTAYSFSSTAQVEYTFDRVGASTHLSLSDNQIRNTLPSYVSSGVKGTRAVLLDSERLAADTLVDLSFHSFDGQSGYGLASGANGVISDLLQVTGLDGKQFVLQMNFDSSMLAGMGAEESKLFLSWFDPATQSWAPATQGNQGGAHGPSFLGSYDSYLTSVGGLAQLGAFGVDSGAHTVWAVLNHNSLFAVSVSAVPEPGTAILAALGAALVVAGSRRRRRFELSCMPTC